jgi:hypothetical protein
MLPREVGVLKHLSVKNFRGLRSLAADLDPVTAFLGPNSSGKTSALHAIRLACDLLWRALASERPAKLRNVEGVDWIVVTEDTLIVDPSSLLPLADWRALFVDQQVGERVAFEVSLSFDEAEPVQAVWVQVQCARNEQLKLSVWVRSTEAAAMVKGLPSRSQHVNRRLTEFLLQHAPRAVFIPPFYGTVPAEELRNRAVIELRLGAGDQSHVVRNLVTGLSPQRFQQLSSFLNETLGGTRLTSRTSGDDLQSSPTLSVGFRDSNGELELSAAGAGLINLVALYAAMSRWKEEGSTRPLIYLLDEPEAHLSPRVQADSAARLARLVTEEFDAQLILATHSVDILNRLAEQGARLLRCEREATPSVTALEGDASLFDDLAGWVDMTPYTAINFLASRRLLFVEGADELVVLPKLAELRFRNDPQRVRAFRRWTIVPLDGAKNKVVADLIARVLQSEAIRARARDAPFQVMVVLDRDYERTPGWTTPVPHGPITHSELVWRQHSLESLLVTPAVLTRWVRAFLGTNTPNDIDRIVHGAVSAADADEVLRRAAISFITGQRITDLLRDGVSIQADYGRAIREATDQAQQAVLADPPGWHRGKDRAAFILGKVREALTPQARAAFPTSVVKLVERTDLSGFGIGMEAIPEEVNALLDRMVAP